MAGFPAKRKHLFYTELEKLIEAGFGIREAANALLESRPAAPERQLLESVLSALDRGETIANAFAGNSTGNLERSIITAGEKGGKLGQAFQHLADYFGLIAKARADALKAMIYPLILLHLGLVLAAIPSDVMSGGIAAEGVLGKLLLSVVGAWAMIALATLLLRLLLKMAPGHPTVDRLLNLVPLVGGARRNLAMARFTKVYHAGLVAGFSMGETALMAGEAAQSGTLREASARLDATARAGNPLGPVFVSEQAFPRAFAKSYATAEESGMLDKDLLRWSRVFEENAAGSVRTLSVVLPKLGYALIVVFVLWKLVSFYSGYYESLEQIRL